jgi:3'(2'), 5'-bisphosphate nucleotidase
MLNDLSIQSINEIAIKAGQAIMTIYAQDFKIFEKEDQSPLTEADQKANEIIMNELSTHYPNIPILSEEGKNIPYEERKNWDYYWCVDPLDGTKEFIKKNGEFTVNIALIHKNTPVLGSVYAPALETLYFAKKNEGAFKSVNEQTVKLPLERLDNVYRVVASRSHLSDETVVFVEELKKEHGDVEFISKGSSLKICLVAENEAQCYPRLAPTMEWDTAAAHAIVLESGRQINIYDGGPMIYNKENLLNPWFVVK